MEEMMNRIDTLTMPSIEGKSPQQALKALYDHCFEVAAQVMHLTNEVADLREKVALLERQR